MMTGTGHSGFEPLFSMLHAFGAPVERFADATALCLDCCVRRVMRKLLLIFTLLCAWKLSASDLTGIWNGQIPGRNGEMQDIAFKFTQNRTTLGGKLYSDYQSTPISEGKISGDQINFVVIAPEQAGNQINRARLSFSESIHAGEIELTREREGATNAGNGGTVQFWCDAKQAFRLKRLL